MLDPASAFPPVVSPEIARPTSLDDASKGEGLEFLAALDEAQANEARTESHVGINVGERPHEQSDVAVEGSQTEGGGDHDADDGAGNRATPNVAGQSETLGSQTTEFAGVDVDAATVIASNGESLSPIAASKEENSNGANLIFRSDGKAETRSGSSEDGQAVTTKVTKIHPGKAVFLPHIARSQSATPTSTNAPPADGNFSNLSTQAASNAATSVATETPGVTSESPKSLVTDGQARSVDLTVNTTAALSQTSNPAATLAARSVAAENRPTVPGQPSDSPITGTNAATPAVVDSELADAASGDTDSSDGESGSSQRESQSPGIRTATDGSLDSGSESPRFNLPDSFTSAGFTTGDSPGTTGDSPAISAAKAALTGTLSWESTNPLQTNAPTVSNATNGNALPGDPWQDTANIRNQVSSSVLSARLEGKSGGHRMEIKLDPPELGKISIEFIGKDNELSARIQAAEPATLTALRADLPALVETLEDAGIVLDEFHLNQSSDDGDFQPGNRGQEESGDQDKTNYDDTTEMDEIDSTRRPSGRLDITA